MKYPIKIRFSDFVRVFFRTFILQAVWNFKSLLSVGFSYALVPVVKRLSRNPKEQAEMLRRYLYFFNAQPYFASFALGALARLEQDRVNGKINGTEQIEKFKNALIGPLGAVGDLYFWGAVKPAAVLLGLSGVLYFESLSWQLTAVGLMLVVFNLPHIQIRSVGLWKGYHKGYETYKYIKIEKFSKIKKVYQNFGALLLGMIVSYLVVTTVTVDPMESVVFVIGIFIAGMLGKRAHATYFAALGALIVAILAGII